MENFSVPYKLVINSKNEGFAGGHNQVYRDTDGEYFLLLNQDMYLQPNCLQSMVDFLDAHTEVGAVSPRLMKWDFSKVAADGLEKRVNQINAY